MYISIHLGGFRWKSEYCNRITKQMLAGYFSFKYFFLSISFNFFLNFTNNQIKLCRLVAEKIRVYYTKIIKLWIKPNSSMSLNLTAWQRPEKTCCFPFWMMGNLHPSDRASCHLVPWPYSVLSHTVSWMLMWHFTICLFYLKRGEQKKKGSREMEEGWSIVSVLEALIVGLAGLHALIQLKSVTVLLLPRKLVLPSLGCGCGRVRSC